MAQKATSHVNQNSKQRQGELPVSIHPDDAKDKVFTAILKALIKMGNKPSSPKELANTIVKHKYATLGGATPFATVSSRISQHFKRAAEHDPPRAPLLAKHVDQNHSRKINYSLATESVSNGSAATETHDDNTTAASSKSRRAPTIKFTSSKKLRSRTVSEEEDGDSEEEGKEDINHVSKKARHDATSTSPSIHPVQKEPQSSKISGYVAPNSPPHLTVGSEEESDGEHSDYHEEMLKDDLGLQVHPVTGRRYSRRASAIHSKPAVEIKKPNNSNKPNNDTAITNSTITHSQEPPSNSSPKLLAPQENAPTVARKPSFSFSSGFPGEQELWTPFSFEHDFDNVFLHDASTAHHIPFNIATPESVSVSELDDYFASTSGSTNRSQRKSFSSTMLGPNDKSLLQKVLLASAARGVADKIEEEDETEADKEEAQAETASKDKEKNKATLSTSTSTSESASSLSTSASASSSSTVTASDPEKTTIDTTATTTTNAPIDIVNPTSSTDSIDKLIDSSSLVDMENGEDFVKFEDDDKKETNTTSNTTITPTPLTTTTPITAAAPVATTTTTTAAAAAAAAAIPTPAPTLPAPINTSIASAAQQPKKMADILPATPTTLSTAEILKSMNIQNLNLSALQQMTSNIPSLQHLSPTFDLAKTMAAYMQTLAKSASASASSSNSPHAMDLKSILTRFPALEAFIKKDPPGTATPPLLSPTTTTEFVPNLVTANNSSTNTTSTTTPSFTAGSMEPIVHTLNAMNPPMYITLIDHIAVCIVVLPKTETTPEYRIMRRVDTGFINGTVLLTAGGIETESERSMILSFEMERVRMPKKKSQLFGTWIPLRRAQELAVTCSIQHKLGHFLEDSIECYFPSPLPIQVNTRKPARDSRLTALALAALRSETKNNGFVVPPISRQSSSSGSMAAAQLQELLLTNPHKALKSNGMMGKAPLLGRYNDKDDSIIPAKATSQRHSSSASATSSINSSNAGTSDKEESDVDIVNTSDSSNAESSNEEESETEADDKAKRTNGTINLEEILSRVASKQPLHIHPRDLQKKRTRNTMTDKKDDETPAPKSSKISHHSRKRSSNSSSNSGGKWTNNSSNSGGNGKSSSSVAIRRSASGSGTTITIKRPHAATSSTSSGSTHSKKGHAKSTPTKHKSEPKDNKEGDGDDEDEEEIDNVVVEHKAVPTIAEKTDSSETKQSTVDEDEDDEDEDIDIGGSDFDDDLR